MNWFYGIVTAFCTAGVCFGALYIICPKGKMERSVKYTVSLCFLTVVIALAGVQVKKADFDFNIDGSAAANTQELQIRSAEYTFSLALTNAGIDFSKIEVLADNSENGSISISKVIVYSAAGRQKILNAIGKGTEYEVEVRNE